VTGAGGISGEARTRGRNQRAKPVQENANKCKEMKANLLSLIFIFFSESGLFNGLRGKKI
jgi:hypothetical protein